MAPTRPLRAQRPAACGTPISEHVAVQVGRVLEPSDVARARVVVAPERFEKPVRRPPPFPSNLHYDAKAIPLFLAAAPRGSVLLNVTS